MFNKKKKYIDFILRWKRYFILGIVGIIIAILTLTNKDESHNENNEMNEFPKDHHLDSNEIKNNQSHTKANTNNKNMSNKENSKEKVYVDIKGAVEHPNVYQMLSTERVIDALNKAKLSKNADVSQINLSEKLIDQKLIYVPTKGEQPHTIRNNNSLITTNQNSENKQVNLNNATESELKGVPGIGPTKAKEIINYREQNGRFDKIDDLKKIKGFGEKTFEKLKEHFTI